MNPMPEPVSIATSVFAGFNTFVKAVGLAAHFKEVPREVKQLHTNIERAESSINTANRLLRLKAHYLDPRLIDETNKSIDSTNTVLLLVRDSIEACRKDLEVQKSVSFKNRAVWLLWKNQEFLSQLQTLGNCLNALDRDIIRMEMARPPIILVNNTAPPAYPNRNRDEDSIISQREGIGSGPTDKLPFPRSPTKRLRSRSNNSSQANLKKSAEIENVPGGLKPGNEGGDEGYESDEGTLSNTPVTAEHSTQSPMEDVTLFANATIGIDTAGLGISLVHSGLPLHRVQFLQFPQDAESLPEHLQKHLNMSELPATHPEEQEDTAPTVPISHSFSSRNPWRKLAAQSHLPSHQSTDSIDRKRTATPSPDVGDNSLRSPAISNSVEGDGDVAKNILGLSITAPAVPSGEGLGDNLLSPETERKKKKWRRKSDFI